MWFLLLLKVSDSKGNQLATISVYLNSFSFSAIIDVVEVDENNTLDISELNDVDAKNLTIQENIDKKDLNKTNEINSLDDDLMKVDQKKINKEIDKQEGLRIESQSNKNIEILKNKKPKSNFIWTIFLIPINNSLDF